MRSKIDDLLEQYWNGDTSLQQEQQLKDYFNSDNVDEAHKTLTPMFQYYESASNIKSDFVPDLSFTEEKSPKVRYLIPKIMGVAASLLLLLTVTYQQFSMDDTNYNNKYTEVENPDEALEIAIEALGFLSNKYKKGTEPMSKNLKNLEKADVFSFDNK